jgi:putative DNA primase/helicase
MAGTGKGKLARSIVRLAYDTEPVFATWGGTAEEFEKRLVSLMLASAPVICIDNVNGSLIQGALLESIITEGRADVRPLGVSQIVSVRNRSLLMLTGNNPTITGDMARRTLPSDIVPRSKDPERDRYSFDPVEDTQKLRIPLLNAAYTIMKAFRQAGMPSHGLPAIGSFNEWSRKVRDPVYWLTNYDLAEAFSQNKTEDPKRQSDAALAAALYDLYGNSSFKSSDVFAIFSKVNANKRATSGGAGVEPQEIALHDALEQVLGSKRVDARSFGMWARRLDGAHNGGFLLETRHNPATNTNEIIVRRT